MNRALIRKILQVITVLLLVIMSAVVGYNYAYMECAIAHQGASAPSYVAFLACVPFLVIIALCLIIIRMLKEKK